MPITSLLSSSGNYVTEVRLFLWQGDGVGVIRGEQKYTKIRLKSPNAPRRKITTSPMVFSQKNSGKRTDNFSPQQRNFHSPLVTFKSDYSSRVSSNDVTKNFLFNSKERNVTMFRSRYIIFWKYSIRFSCIILMLYRNRARIGKTKILTPSPYKTDDMSILLNSMSPNNSSKNSPCKRKNKPVLLSKFRRKWNKKQNVKTNTNTSSPKSKFTNSKFK